MESDIAEHLRMFYVSHRQELFTYALSLTRCRMAAEDAVQTAFSRVLQRGRLPNELRPYVFRCVRNAAIDALRVDNREHGDTSLFNGRQTERMALEFRMEIEEMLGQLSEAEREIIVLKLYGGLTFQEIARVRRIPQGTAASLYRRGIEKLRAIEELENRG